MKDSRKQPLRPLAREMLLWALRLAAAVILILVVYLIQNLWQEFADNRPHSPSPNVDRNVGRFNLNDTISNQTENIRWVNLFLDDVIITSKHPQQLRVENLPAAVVDRSVAPDEAPSKEGESQSASFYQPPITVHRGHNSGDSTSEEEEDSLEERRITLRASLQGFKRIGALVRYPFDERWSLETGLIYGSPKTTDNHNSCFSIPLRAIYDIKTIKGIDLYVLGGTIIEKVCKGNTSLQLLLQAGIGAEYHFNKRWGVFLEPSLRYHIGNDSNIPELYGKRLGMNIHFGVTYSLGK